MLRKLIIMVVALQGACSAGPDQIKNYKGLAVAINLRPIDVAKHPGGAAGLVVDAVDYCANTGYEEEVELVGIQFFNGGLMDPAGMRFELQATSESLGRSLCYQRYNKGLLRFYRVSSNWWAPIGHDLVHAETATVFSPLGPSGPTVTLPKGYAWLRRTCGTTPGTFEMTVVSTDQTVDLYYQDMLPFGPIEPQERAFVEGCGATVPIPDLGSRISFDRAESLAWSPDGATIYYLAPADPTDLTRSISLRQVRLADGASAEIVTIPHADGLQTDSAGNLYVSTAGMPRKLLRVDTSSTPASLFTVPVSANTQWSLSPNGRWGSDGARLWDLQANAEIQLTGCREFLGWSPDSSLTCLGQPDSSTLLALSPSDPGQPKTYGTIAYPAPPTYRPTLVWNTEGPLLARAPQDWVIQSPGDEVCWSCFGLSLQSPNTGPERTVLDTSAGRIRIVNTQPVLGFMLVWVRNCLGLYNTVCSSSLVRVDVEHGTTRVVAVSPTEVPVAVSSDHQSVALAAPGGIYVKSLAQ